MFHNNSPKRSKISLGATFILLIPVIYISITLFFLIFGDVVELLKSSVMNTNTNSNGINTDTIKDILPPITDSSLFNTNNDIELYYKNALLPLVDVIKTWPPEQAGVAVRPVDWVDVVPRFDWNDIKSREAALRVRKSEKPFIIRNVPSVVEATSKWSEKYLKSQFGNKHGTVEKSDTNSFMYWNGRKNRNIGGGPTNYNPMSWGNFKEKVKSLENTISGAPHFPHYYWHTSSKTDAFISEDLKLFKKSDSFFIVDPDEYTVPIACRVGTKGLCNEMHYDTHRTFAAQIIGSKRWIFLPPTDCNKLYLYPTNHMSSRHSPIDINTGLINITKYPLAIDAMAIETVVHQGEVAYLPSNWFHHIISQEYNIQCIARSGHSLVGDDSIEKCGFKGLGLGRGKGKGKKNKLIK